MGKKKKNRMNLKDNTKTAKLALRDVLKLQKSPSPYPTYTPNILSEPKPQNTDNYLPKTAPTGDSQEYFEKYQEERFGHIETRISKDVGIL